MKFNIRGSRVKVTKAISSYIEEKIGKLDKYFENPDDIIANVIIKVRGIDQIVEVTIPIKKFIIRCEESNRDLYASIDLVADKIERQIRKNKTRMNKKTNRANFTELNMDFEPIEADEQKIVKRKTLETKPMSEEEAILQMDLLGHEFFIFKDVDSEQIAVLYRRKDGNLGIIETK